MDKLKQLVNLTNSDGEVITLFNGKITLSQLLMVILCLFLIGLVWKFIKGTVKVAGIVIIIVCGLVYFGIASPEQISSVAEKVKEVGVEAYQKFADASENIKIEDDKLYILLEGEWTPIEEISTVAKGKLDALTIGTENGSFGIKDETVAELLEELQSE